MLTAADLIGVTPPVVTPVTESGEVDFDGLRHVVRHVLAGGVHAVFTLGSTGNFCSFTEQERAEVVQTVVGEVAGRVPVLAGCSDTTTRLVLRHIRLAAAAGADAVIVEPPYLFPVEADDVVRHYQALAAVAPVPVIVYSNPGDTKVSMPLSLVRRLAELPNVVGIKDSSLDYSGFQSLLREFSDDRFRVLQGIEALAGASFLAGAKGAILAIANVVPHLCVRLYEAGRTGQVAETSHLQAQLMKAYAVLREPDDDAGGYHGQETVAAFFGGLECALDQLGVCQHVVTLPYPTPSAAARERARKILQEVAA
jgi:dihydrodipicolinate synthase/N-acetylneuraminate lyase